RRKRDGWAICRLPLEHESIITNPEFLAKNGMRRSVSPGCDKLPMIENALEVQRRPTMKKHSSVETQRNTIGIDVSDRSSCYCVLDKDGEISAEGKLRSAPEAYRQQFAGMAPALIAMEAGTHSRWMSALLRECGHEVI